MTALDFKRLTDRNRTGAGLMLFGVLLLLILAGETLWPNAFFPAYWFGLMFWFQLSIGCLVLLLIQMLTAGKWGEMSAPLLRRGATGLFILLPFFLPAFFALPHIFSWTNIRIGLSEQVLVNKQIWLNPAAFILRAIFFLAILAALTRYWSHTHLRAGEPRSGWSGPALVVVVLVLSLASCDWMMSLEPTFYSSLYPFMYFSGAMVSTLCALCAFFSGREMRASARPDTALLHALGKLLFASVLFWGYIVFSQFIIIWTGNLPDEADWYVIRTNHGWQWLTLFVILFHFVVPFCLLLSEKLKRDPRRLFMVSTALFVIHFTELYWLMAPEKGVPFHLNLFDFLLPPLIGACWIWFIAGPRQNVEVIDPLMEAVT